MKENKSVIVGSGCTENRELNILFSKGWTFVEMCSFKDRDVMNRAQILVILERESA